MKKVLIAAVLLCAVVTAQTNGPKSYAIKKLATGATITVNGNPDEWNESYFIDSLEGDHNVYSRPSAMTTWTRDMFQYQLYLAYSSNPTTSGDTGYIYGLVIVTRDPGYMVGSGSQYDNLKFNPGGQKTAFYINSDGSSPRLNTSCPYTNNVTLHARTATYGYAGTLPIYEFALRKDIFDQLGLMESGIPMQFSFGSEENKPRFYSNSGNDQVFLAVGAYRIATMKDDWDSNPWDDAGYYPTFTLSSESGVIAAEVAAPAAIASATLTANPNPFIPATTLSYTATNNGTVKVFDASGKMIFSEKVNAGSGKVMFNARDLASGVYVARLEAGKSVVNTKLFLTR